MTTTERNEAIRQLMPMAKKMAFNAMCSHPNIGLNFEDFYSFALEGTMNAVDKYESYSGLTLGGFAWYHIKSRHRVLVNNAKAHKRKCTIDIDSYDRPRGFKEALSWDDLLGKEDLALEDQELLLEIFRYAKDEYDLIILNGMLYGITMEKIGESIGMSKQAVSVRFNNLKNKTKAAIH